MSGHAEQETEQERRREGENKRVSVCATIYRSCVRLNTAEVDACVFSGAE